MRMANETYLTVVTMIRVQITSDRVPSATARSGLPPESAMTVFRV